MTIVRPERSKTVHKFRMSLLSGHRWIGRAAIFYLSFLFLTGTILVFGPELESFGSPQMRGKATSSPASFGQMFDSAVEAFPTARPLIVSSPSSRWLAATVEMQDGAEKFIVWTDTADGLVQGTTSELGFKEILRKIHTNLMIDSKVALLIVTFFSIPLMWQLFSGLVSYRRFWRGFFRLPARSQRNQSQWASIHRLTGLWVLPILSVSGLTAFFYFTEALGIDSRLPSPAPPAVRHSILPSGFDGTSLDRIVEIAEDTLPGLVIREIYLPTTPKSGIRLRGELTALVVRPRANTVTIDPTNNIVLGAHRGEDLSIHRRITEAADPLHFGLWGGQITRFIWAISGALAVVLMVSASKILAWKYGGEASQGAFRAAWRTVPWPARVAVLPAVSVISVGLLRAFF